MDKGEIEILLNDLKKRREREMARRATLWAAVEESRAERCEPGHSAWDRRAMRNKEIEARMACDRIDNEVWRIDSEIRALERELMEEHAAFFNRVRRVVEMHNVVSMPFSVDQSPEAA